jgi:hypothetical protein
MSVNQLLTPNALDLHCRSITAATGGVVLTGLIRDLGHVFTTTPAAVAGAVLNIAGNSASNGTATHGTIVFTCSYTLSPNAADVFAEFNVQVNGTNIITQQYQNLVSNVTTLKDGSGSIVISAPLTNLIPGVNSLYVGVTNGTPATVLTINYSDIWLTAVSL